MSALQASLFVSTYEMPKHLELVCAGLARQSAQDFEIFFCDDGSSDETAQLIRSFQNSVKIPVHHVWQEHKGFRKCRILNQALRRASGEICIFLDGDCIPHKDYVRDHLDQQELGRYLAGRRVELGPVFSSQLTVSEIQSGLLDKPSLKLLKSVVKGDSEYFNRSIRISYPPLRKLLKMDRVVDLKGCNYSVPKAALESINGFDESYEGYGREDTDVEIRLQNSGLKIKSLKGMALQYHVWHPRRNFTPANDEKLEELRKTGRVLCTQGLRQNL